MLSLAGRSKSLVQLVHSSLHAPTRTTRFSPPQRPLLLQVNFGIVKYTPLKVHPKLHSRSFSPRAIQFTSRGMCAPMGSLPLRKGATMRTIRIQNNQWSLEHYPVLHLVKKDHPPPNPYISETAFSHRFSKSIHIPPPPPTTGRNFGALDQKFTKARKSAKTHRVGTQRMSS